MHKKLWCKCSKLYKTIEIYWEEYKIEIEDKQKNKDKQNKERPKNEQQPNRISGCMHQ